MKKIIVIILSGVLLGVPLGIVLILNTNRANIIINELNQIKSCSNVYIDREEIKIKVSIVEIVRGKNIKVQTVFPDKHFNIYDFNLHDIRFMQCSTNVWVKDFGNKLLRELNK